jgi:alkanesulfonate monooxygenase SsuD/methylene tetrahydromethanopterin reductase-like flavin-dependent oxidoreductase (luciferase family)
MPSTPSSRLRPRPWRPRGCGCIRISSCSAGYLVDEFAALGVPFEERNERSDEAIPAMKAAWSGESVKLSGGSFEARGNTMLPAPVQKPHPPIWIGGNAPRAIRRAVDHAQGWSPFPLPRAHAGRNASGAIESIEDLARGIRRMHEYAEQQGRTEPLDVNFVPFGMQMNRSQPLDVEALREQFGALAEAGVNWVSVGMPTASQSAYLEALEEFAQHFLSS